MEITWYGHSCFKLYEPGMASVITDPFDHHAIGYRALSLKADIVSISHNSPGHNYLAALQGNPFIIDTPGEFEIGDVFVTGIETTNNAKNGQSTRNNLYVFDFQSISIVHLGNLNHIPSQTEIEDLGPVHVALVPVGGGSSLNAARAVEVISLLEPNIVIPMHYSTSASTIELDPIQKFLKEMGINEVETKTVLSVPTDPNLLPTETQVVVLDYQ